MSVAGMDNEEGWQSSLEKALPEYHMSIHRQPSAFRTRPYSFLVNCDPFRREDWKKKKGSPSLTKFTREWTMAHVNVKNLVFNFSKIENH